jgi:glycosyltransferase involved in cell wall biosynthesis
VHILLFTEDFPEPHQATGGLRVSIRRQAEGLAERGRVTVVHFHRLLPPLPRYVEKRIVEKASARLRSPEQELGSTDRVRSRDRLRVFRYPYLHLPVLWPITEPLQILALGFWAILRHARDADVFHGHCIYAMGVPAVLLGKLTGRPSVSTAHGTDLYVHSRSDRPPIRFWTRLVLKGATRVIAVSTNLAEMVASLGVGEDRRRFVPNGVDIGRFRPVDDPRPFRERLGLPLDAHIFLSLGLFIPQKGHRVLVEAFRRLSERRPESYLVLAGDGPLRAEIAAQMTRAGLDERVRFLGLLSHEEVAPWIAASNALLLPSLDEGMPLAILEAFASARPLVGTTAGGIPEVVNDDRLGILVPPNDPEAFANAMEESMDRTWDTNVLRARAEEFGWPTITDKLLAVYREIGINPDPDLR